MPNTSPSALMQKSGHKRADEWVHCSMRVFLSLSVLFLLGSLSSCRLHQRSSMVDTVIPEPAILLEHLRRQSLGRSNLRAIGRVTIFGPEGRLRLRTVLVAERPRSFRVETLTPFEQPVDVMCSNGDQLWLLREGHLFVGPATEEHISRVLPLPLRPEELVEVLLGGVPISAHFEPVSLEEQRGYWRLKLQNADKEVGFLSVDPDTLRVVEAQLFAADGSVRVEIHFEGFTKAADGGPAIPTRIRARVPPQELDVRIRLREAETDVKLGSEVFEMHAAPHIAVEPFPS